MNRLHAGRLRFRHGAGRFTGASILSEGANE